MMSVYNPDVWVMLKITTDKYSVYKVLAGWYGSFVHGDSWKLNSGVTHAELEGDVYTFSGWSGSFYQCHKDTYKLSGMTSGMLASFQKEIEGLPNASIEVMPEDTNWLELDYGE